MSAVVPFTVGDGNDPIASAPLSNAVRKSQFACPRAVRKSAAICEKSGFLLVLIPVFQPWKQ